MQRAAADVDRKVHHGDVILQQVAGYAAQDAADQNQHRQPVVMQAERLVDLFDGERRVGLHSCRYPFSRTSRAAATSAVGLSNSAIRP